MGKCPMVDLHHCHHYAVSLLLPWKMRLLIFVHSAITNASRYSDGTVNCRLLSFLDSLSPTSPKPVAGSWIPLIVFFYGSGFTFLSLDSRVYNAVCRWICQKVNTLIASLNYRLLPEHRWPVQYDDEEDVLQFLDGGVLARSDPPAAGFADLSYCFLTGGSAGANVAHQWAAATYASE